VNKIKISVGNVLKRRNIQMKEEPEKKKHHQKLGEMLIYYKVITPAQLEEGLKIKKNTEKRIGEILINLGRVTQDEINWVLGRQLNLPYVQVNIDNIDIQLSNNISENALRKFKAIPLMELNDQLVVAMADPTDEEAIEMLKEVTKRKLKLVLASFENIDETINRIFSYKK
jgi:type IV pilus assembly protein PilB